MHMDTHTNKQTHTQGVVAEAETEISILGALKDYLIIFSRSMMLK